MSERLIVGLSPRLPPPLNRSRWWTEPIAAERLAAFRIAVGLVLILDLSWTYLPHLSDFFGPTGLSPTWQHNGYSVSSWSLLFPVAENYAVMVGVMGLWLIAAIALTLGWATGVASVVCFMLAVSMLNVNPWLHNGGDRVRCILLLHLSLAPAGAVWSIDRWRAGPETRTILVTPWPLRLLMVQMCFIYTMNGLYKCLSPLWLSGEILIRVHNDGAWSRVLLPAGPWEIPPDFLRLVAWTALFWELFFPLLLWLPMLRWPTIIFGLMLHLGTTLLLELGTFGLFMCCFYVPLFPWERLRSTQRDSAGTT